MADPYGYIDMHSHILPGVDDGAQSMKETKEMLKIAYEQGIRSIIATPHYDSTIKRDNSILLQQLELVQEEAFKIDSQFRIYLGNEIYYENGCLSAVKSKQAFTMADSRYVLIEFSPQEDYKTIYNGMKDFILEGYRPIIAHVERYACLRKKGERMQELSELGCYLQINASSLTGGLFYNESANLRKLIIANQIHFVATDCHNLTSRQPVMCKCIKKLSKYLEETKIQKLFYDNQMKILEDTYI